MNVTSTTKTITEAINKEKQDSCCENIANSVSSFNLVMTNISNKLGLSKAIYLK